jgi:small subunit ribosomal protein S17
MSKKRIKGKIVSDKMQKTVVVEVAMSQRHPVYGKVVKRTRRFKARNETEAKLGDVVFIEECRPYSKQVSWKVVEITE